MAEEAANQVHEAVQSVSAAQSSRKPLKRAEAQSYQTTATTSEGFRSCL